MSPAELWVAKQILKTQPPTPLTSPGMTTWLTGK